MSISPTKESIPKLAPPTTTSLHPPPSPGSHRALRRLKSAHTLGSGNNQPSLISQQHRQVLSRNFSPARRDIPQSAPRAHSRGRSNSDATSMSPSIAGSAGRRPAMAKRPSGVESSVDRLIRDGPPESDLGGGLDIMRLKILDQGIKSDSDGMVSPILSTILTSTNRLIVISSNICLAHPPQCAGARHR